MTTLVHKDIDAVIQKLLDVAGQLAEYSEKLDGLRVDYESNAVSRNSILVDVTYPTHINKAQMALFNWAVSDKNHLSAQSDIGNDLFLRKMDLERIGAEIAEKYAFAKQAAEMVDARMAAAYARLKEHAPHNEAVRKQVLALTDGRCFYCEVEIGDMHEPWKQTYHIDHLVPKTHGGPDHISNYVPSCAKCNGAKSDKHYVEFVRQRRGSASLKVINGGQE